MSKGLARLRLVRACVAEKYFFKTQNRHKGELRDVALRKIVMSFNFLSMHFLTSRRL